MKDTRKALGILGLVLIVGATVGASKSPIPPVEVTILQDQVHRLELAVKELQEQASALKLRGPVQDPDIALLKTRVRLLEKERDERQGEKDNKTPVKE